jgi:hypothetical protein
MVIQRREQSAKRIANGERDEKKHRAKVSRQPFGKLRACSGQIAAGSKKTEDGRQRAEDRGQIAVVSSRQ